MWEPACVEETARVMCGCACRSVTVRRLRLEHSARLSEIVRDVMGGCIRPQTFVNDGHGGRDDSMNGCGCEFDLRVGCKTTYGVIYIHTLIYYVHREIDICTDTYIHREREMDGDGEAAVYKIRRITHLPLLCA